ncbi:uncharacterized protein fam83ga isoform X2 [Eucyclogobius newberryi]|uniref:uncharacterized protein fam83ga isoform X2 n=1 Tax=Eucyclogobius newberryi TaxID=166745 RepID=UPI003B59070A
MALSQIQCLDENHVNPRTHESKAEFLYCEEQRNALETLLRDGREAFFKQLEARGLRGFLSDLELEALAGTVEPFDPGVDLYREDPDDEQTPLSLHYWPDHSDMSTPELDMGWPSSESYRGVTRVTVHTQPPLDGPTHIKEVIRKTIAQAQKVIAVVMDVFTDVDIFRDLLDASYKRKVSVYILLDRTSIPHFLSMCQRANMHPGHLKNLRVRCSGGVEFYTQSCTKVSGQMGHRFMFVDGDKALTGSYSFTWMASRLDRSLMTVITGQAVEAFDRLFCLLYSSSKLVNLQRVATEPEPEPEPVPPPAAVAPVSAAIARKLYNPKYSLVAAAKPSLSPSSSPGENSPKGTKNEALTKKGCRRQSKDVVLEAPPLHPGLVDLEKAYLIDYLPTWPEPDPSSDVIGFINIRDTNKPSPIHLQRSEMFEVSQAIRFSSPFSKQKESLPEVATPRNATPSKHEVNAAQPQKKTPVEAITPKTENLTLSESGGEKSNAPSQKPPLQTPAKQIHSSTANLNPLAPSQSVETVTTPTVSANSTKTEENIYTQTSVLKSESTLQNRNPTQTHHAPKLFTPSDSNSLIKTQEHNSNDNTSPTGNIPVTSTAASANYQLSQAAAVHSTLTSASPALTAISTSVSKPNTNSPIAPSPVAPPPIPKPRTVQLVIKDSPSAGRRIQVSFVKKENRGEKVSGVYNEPLVAIAPTPKETEKVPELANKSASKSIPQISSDDSAVKTGSQEKESKTSQEKDSVDAGDKGEVQPKTNSKEIAGTEREVSKVLIGANVTIDEDIPSKGEDINVPKGTIIERSDFPDNKPEEVLNTNSDVAKGPSQASSKIGQTYCAKASVPQKITYSSSEDNLDSLKSLNDRSQILERKTESTAVIAVATQGMVDESVQRTAKSSSRSPLLSPRGVPKRPTQLHLNTSQMTDPTIHVKESNTINKTLLAQKHSPLPDKFSPRIPTPDSRRSHTPDFRTPSSDVSDGYGSTTSDEFYECSESPFRESLDPMPPYSLNALEEKDIAITNSYGGFKEQAALLRNDRTMSSCETLNSSNKGSLSSIVEKTDDEDKLAKDKMPGREESRKSDENFEAKVVKDINQSKSKKASAVVEQSLTPKLNNEEAGAKRMPVRELKTKRVYSRAEQPNRVASDGETTGLSTSEVERRDTAPPANKEPEGHKEKDSTVLVQTRPAQASRPPCPLSATQSTLAQRTERKMSDGNLPTLDSSCPSPSSRMATLRPPAAKASSYPRHRPPPASPTKPKAGQTQNPSLLPIPQPSFLYTHPQTMQPTHVSPSHQAQAGTIPERPGSEEEKSAFGITFSKFYNLKGLKDKMSKRPTQSKRSSGGGSTQQRKSTG